MDIITIFGIAVGLAMDAFAVSIASGAVVCSIKFRNAFKLSFTFGLFQAFMPVIGWYAAIRVKSFIQGIDHWIAFVLLTIVGAKMIYESFALQDNESKMELFSLKWLVALGIATSIDALVIGITFAFLNVSIVIPAAIIGIVCFTFSFFGFVIGCKIGHLFERRIETIGGIILIGIGLKILLEHLFF